VEIKPPTISKIEISQADLDRLKRILQSNRAASFTKVSMQRKIVGICTGCLEIPDFIITRYYEGLQKIEKYCAKCIDQTTIEKNKKRDTQILSKVQVVKSVSELTRLRLNQQRPTDQ
jgi:hypothetical protein